ncbi:Metallo-dependent phosphatase-like protein [Lipomyces oligophaga]|uniref:Metallo-dependent phosphatase-like protein n=1 Tax=Lipomyces oligophaga TaxID=45792 RepID=UPI0034D00769
MSESIQVSQIVQDFDKSNIEPEQDESTLEKLSDDGSAGTSLTSIETKSEQRTPTADEKAEASLIKNQANEVLASGNYQMAVQLYSKAIDLDPTSEIYWSNRAQAYIKDEMYGAAIQDATEAIRINPDYVKSYYRRAVAYTSLLRPQLALLDFKAVCARAPNDKNARSKRDECQKVVRRLAFEAAIEVADEPSVADSIDYESMTLEASYDGVKLESDSETNAQGLPKLIMTQAFIDDMILRFKAGKRLPRKYLFAIIIETMAIFRSEPTMVEVEVGPDELMSVCGDTHGQFYDVLELFRFNGRPDERHIYLFNGDFVDRGSWSTEVAFLFLAYKWLYPTRFYLNRGNHEADEMNKVYGFEGECKAKYSEKVFKLFSEAFSLLPLATLIGGNYFVLHGGLFSDDSISLDDVRKFNRFAQKQPGQAGIMMEMLWTDPQPEPGRGPSKRGIGLQFGPDVTKRFCDANNLMAVIRSHEVRMGGYEIEHGGRLVTVFSAPNYCDSQGNKAAVINIKSDYELTFQTYDAVEHPNIKPMAYASNLMN